MMDPSFLEEIQLLNIKAAHSRDFSHELAAQI